MLYLDLTIFTMQKVGGISVVWAEYLKRLKQRSSLDVTLRLPDNDNEIARQSDFSDYKTQRVSARGSASKFLPYLMRGKPGDVLHTSYYQWFPFFRGTRIVTLHDFMHELYAPARTRLPHNALKFLSLRSADIILCISEATRDDLRRFYPGIYRASSVHVVENAASKEYYPAPSKTEAKYLLWVAGRGGYKNFIYALDALAHLNRNGRQYELRVVGPELNQMERDAAQSRGILEQISVFSGLSTAQLRTMYSDAFALVYLSKYEGFGLPILEAQQCGCPVIVLDNPSSREVGQDSVLVLDDTNVERVAQFADTLSDDAQRQAIVDAGLKNAERYDWDSSVDKLINIYSSCLAGEQGSQP